MRGLADIVRDQRSAAVGNAADKAFAHFYPRLDQLKADVISADHTRFKDIRTVVIAAPDQKNPCRVVMDQRAERVHDLIQQFIQIERTTDRARDLEEQAQLIDRIKRRIWLA